MKRVTVVLLVAISVAFAGFAEAAKPKKRTRNANRVGARQVQRTQATEAESHDGDAPCIDDGHGLRSGEA